MQKRRPKSLRKYIRKTKALIRRQSLDKNKQKEAIKELYNSIKIKKYEDK